MVYCSATGATEPGNMGYMTRLGLWGPGTPFDAFESFRSAVDRGGVGMMELVAMHLKSHGSYISRSLSYHGCHFQTVEDAISDEASAVYDAAAVLWQELYFELKRGLRNGTLVYPSKSSGNGDDDGLDLLRFDDDDEELDDHKPLSIATGNAGVTFIMRYFWAAHQVRHRRNYPASSFIYQSPLAPFDDCPLVRPPLLPQ